MDSSRFARAYPETPEEIPPADPERREMLEAPRQWSRFFGDVLHDYLSDELEPIDDWFIAKLHDYFDWNETNLAADMKRNWKIDNPLSDSDVSDEFTFHRINGPFSFLWYHMLYGEVGKDTYTPTQMGHMQTHLAVGIAPLARRYKQLNAEGSATATHVHHKEWRRLRGLLSEADAAVILTELMLEERTKGRDILILPAPKRFEDNPRDFRKNADFIIIDRELREAHGLQVKTQVIKEEGIDRYNSRYITMIDAAHDLGNLSIGLRENVVIPGQVTMSLLASRSMKDCPPYTDRSAFLSGRAMAIELTRTHKPVVSEAVHHISARVLEGLMRQNNGILRDDIEELEEPQSPAA